MRKFLPLAFLFLLIGCARPCCVPEPQPLDPSPSFERPPNPQTIDIVGNYAGREMSISIDGRIVHEGIRYLEPEGVIWRLKVGKRAGASVLSVDIEDCESKLETTLPAPSPDDQTTLLIRDCELEILG